MPLAVFVSASLGSTKTLSAKGLMFIIKSFFNFYLLLVIFMFVNAINTKEVPNVSTDKLSLKNIIYLPVHS